MRSLLLLAFTLPLLAQTPDHDFFEKKVRPIFAAQCAMCHGAKAPMGGLNLSSATSVTGVVVAGDAEHSRLYEALTYAGKIKMPPTGKLPDAEIAIIREWISSGAVMPKESPVVSASGSFEERARAHWAFQPLSKTVLPPVKDAQWPADPIDRFILAKLEAKGLRPAAATDKLTLLRRVTYDLTGLPPTLNEIAEFEIDKSPHAYAKVVDRLLASKRYGEHWGRHWLDVARYADSTGMDEDNAYPHAWRYRDYVIDAFNKDLPYDRFVTEQLAGDLLPAPDTPTRARQLVATGFLAIGPRPLAQQDRLQMIYDVVDEQIDTVTKSLLGITVACARCHDHKFDPIPTKDYYGLAGMFARTASFRNQGRPGAISYMHYEALDPAAFNRYQAHRWRMLAKRIEMEDVLSEDAGRENATLRNKIAEALVTAWKIKHEGAKGDGAWVKWIDKVEAKARTTYLKEWFAASSSTIGDVALAMQKKYAESGSKWDEQLSGWRTRFSKEGLQDRDVPERPKFDPERDPFFAAATFDGGPLELKESARVQFLRQEWKKLEDTLPPAPDLASAVSDGVDVPQHVFVRGDLHSQGEPVAIHFPIAVPGQQPTIEKGSGRLQFAEWLFGPKNPLTSRVIVNRVWQWHFGEGLMRTPNNWGKTGEQPTHPELLDYLATHFQESGWSFKKLHREILLSSTYRMSSTASAQARAADPANRLWSRFQRTRMSVEQMRDSLLAVDGSLDETMGGSLAAGSKEKKPKVSLDEVLRRTVYVPVRRGSIPTLLSTFDFGDATTSNEGRSRTNVAPQALFLLNSKFAIDRARGVAAKLLADDKISDGQRVERVYLQVLGRRPTGSDTDSVLTYIAGLENKLQGADARATAWQSLCHILLSTNEFLYLN